MARVCLGLGSAAVAAAVMVGCGGTVVGSDDGTSGPKEALLLGAEQEDTIGTQRSAIAYGEAVLLEPDDAYTEICAGVLIAPRVVLTAAHCVAWVARKTWKVTAPFMTTGPHSAVARDGEPMDAAFKNATRENYVNKALRDVALVYLDQPFENATKAIVGATGYPTDVASPPTFVAAVGRTPNGAEPLVLSAATLLSTGTNASIEYGTKQVTTTGQSGGALFVEGTHKLVAVHAGTDALGRDRWTRLDGDVYTWMTQKVSSHGGWFVRD